MEAQKIILFLRANGVRSAIRTLRYTRWRDRLDQAYARRNPAAPFIHLGECLGAEATISGALFMFAKSELEVLFLAEDLVRISWKPGKEPPPYALAKTEWPTVGVELVKKDAEHSLRTDLLEIVIGVKGALSFKDPYGKLLRSEFAPERTDSALEEPVHWRQRAQLMPDEAIYGLGEQAAPLNRRGQSFRMWNTDPGGSYGYSKNPLYINIPCYLALHSQGSYLIFYENSFPATLNFGQSEVDKETSQVQFDGGMHRYYLMPGPPDLALERFSELTGRPPLPPLWALGYHQSRWGYKNEADIRSVAQGFQDHDLPISAIHLDIDYMDGYRVFTVDKNRFPDLTRLAQDLDDQGIKTVTILDPGVKKDPHYYLYQDGLKQDTFCKLPDGKLLEGLVWPGWSVYPDFTKAATRNWWGMQYPRLLDQGIAGIWHDMNEPTSFAAWGDMTLPLSTHHDLDSTQGDHRQAHNLYGLLMNKAGYEALRSLRPQRRPWLVTRSGWAGLQRYAWNWTGDIESSWEALRMTIPTLLGQGLSGLAFSGPDIGGFSGSPSPELYLRWFQMAAFLPFFRTHSAIGIPAREPWTFEEPILSILRKFLKLRQQILPFYYSLAWIASQRGIPPVRPLFWANTEDQALWSVDDAFLLGDSLLIAPILEEGASQRMLQLPSGRWYNFWDDALVEGPAKVNLQAGLERIPILVRAGSVLPMQENKVLILHIYPPSSGYGGGLLYSDAGDGYDDFRLDQFILNQRGQTLTLTRQTQGGYQLPYREIKLVLHAMAAKRILVNGNELSGDTGLNQVNVPQFERVVFELNPSDAISNP
jgi:alpha-glucosidase